MPCATVPEPGPQEIKTESGLRNVPLDRPGAVGCACCRNLRHPGLLHSQSCFPPSPFTFKAASRNFFPAEPLDVDGSTKPGAGSGSGTCSAPSQPLLLPGNRDVPSAWHRSWIRGTNRTRAARKSHGISAVGSLQLPKLLETWQLQRMGLSPSFLWCPMGMSLVLWGWIHPNPVLPIQLKNPLLCYFLYKIYLFIHKNKKLHFP